MRAGFSGVVLVLLLVFGGFYFGGGVDGQSVAVDSSSSSNLCVVHVGTFSIDSCEPDFAATEDGHEIDSILGVRWRNYELFFDRNGEDSVLIYGDIKAFVALAGVGSTYTEKDFERVEWELVSEQDQFEMEYRFYRHSDGTTEDVAIIFIPTDIFNLFIAPLSSN